MLCSRTPSRRREGGRRLAEVLSVAAVAVLSGCGFQPLYSTRSEGPGAQMQAALHHVHIATIPDRAGMRLRQHLGHLLAPQGLRMPIAHTLSVTLKGTERPKGFRLDGSAAASDVVYTAQFRLMEHRKGRLVLKDQVVAATSYTISRSAATAAVAMPAAAESAADHTVQLLAKLIAERVAAYFAIQTQSPPHES